MEYPETYPAIEYLSEDDDFTEGIAPLPYEKRLALTAGNEVDVKNKDKLQYVSRHLAPSQPLAVREKRRTKLDNLLSNKKVQNGGWLSWT